MEKTPTKTEQKLLDKAKTLPAAPGCYLLKNRYDEVIYVGKAKNLRSRVSSYFHQGKKTVKTEILVSHVKDIDFILTQTDTEAYVLENNLIKKHAPKYNIRLKDDKSYPYIVVDTKKDFPRLLYQRKVKRGTGKKVYGPFAHGSNISEVLRIIVKSFKLRDCTDREMNSRKEPCILYQMNQCTAPCVKYVSPKEYDDQIKQAIGLFSGKGKKSIKYLKDKMNYHAENEEFEKAAQIRDNVISLEKFAAEDLQKNAELDFKEQDVDIVAFYIGEHEVDIAIYLIRSNFLLGHKNFHFSKADTEESNEEEVIRFLLQYYTESKDTLPKVISFPIEHEEYQHLGDVFSQLTKENVKVVKGEKRFESLSELALGQAKEYQKVRFENKDSVYVGLNRLKELLSMKERPVVLECYDIAIWQGSSPTASQIVFHDGKPEKKKYRYYHLEELPEGNNDFEMMRQVFRRRLKHGNLPDVFVVDGGKAQVNTVVEVLKEFEIDVPVVGIAKARNEKSSEERLIIPGRSNPYILQKNRSLMTIVVNMRDEAHRFSRKLHHKSEKNRIISSGLDQVSGIGPKAREKILSKLDRKIEEFAGDDVEYVMGKFGISKSVARKFLDYAENLKSDGDD